MLVNRVMIEEYVYRYDYYTNFKGDTIGGKPSGWNLVGDQVITWKIAEDTEAIGKKVLELNNPYSPIVSSMLVWQEASGLGDFETQLKIKSTGNNGNNRNDMSVILEWRDMISSTYSITFRKTSGRYIHLTVFGTDVAFAWTPNAWYYVKLRRQNGVLMVKVWEYGNKEPTSWLGTTTIPESYALNIGVGGPQFSSETTMYIDEIFVDLL